MALSTTGTVTTTRDVKAAQWLQRNQADIAPWKVLPRLKTGSLQLVCGDATIRVLRGLDGGLPVPGTNKARRAFYMQPTITGMSVEQALPGLEMSKFIATWEVLDLETFEVGIRVFRTTGTFEIGDQGKADLAFWLPNDADELDHLTFEPSDDGIDLPIAQEESGDEPVHG